LVIRQSATLAFRLFAILPAEGELDPKQWTTCRLQELADVVAVAVGGFSVIDNHLHVLVRLDPAIAVRFFYKFFANYEGPV
jgi:hypothetical protein